MKAFIIQQTMIYNLSKEEILENTSLTEDLLNKIIRLKKSEDLKVGFGEWKDVPPIEKGRTDIYFFGEVASGKSCILASIFYYADKNGRQKSD